MEEAMTKERVTWIDIAKGLGILFVVIGHSGNLVASHYLFWFHMPLFFFLSGILFEPISHHDYLKWTKRKCECLIIPYLSYGILITIIFSVFNPSISYFIKSCIHILYGGLLLTGQYGVFWFVTCLLLTQLLFGYLSRFTIKMQIFVICFSYILGHVLSASSFAGTALPWHIDAVLITIAYYALGYYMKGILSNILDKMMTLVLSAALCVMIILLDYHHVIKYSLDIKYKVYHHVFLDIFVPLVIILFITSACYWLSKISRFNVLSYLGRNTLTIMYLHISVNKFIKDFFHVDYGVLTFTLFGVVISLVIGILFKQSTLFSYLFLGKKLQFANVVIDSNKNSLKSSNQ
jgi:polysaccharide biosynthesis protein PslL